MLAKKDFLWCNEISCSLANTTLLITCIITWLSKEGKSVSPPQTSGVRVEEILTVTALLLYFFQTHEERGFASCCPWIVESASW